MEYTAYTSVKNQFSATPNLCDLFKLLSIETWKRMEYAYLKPGIKLFETTITQNILFSINAFNDQYNLNVEIFEAVDENTNGNDFELIIRFPKAGIEYYAPIQAKKVYRDGKYHSMDHGDQIESLKNYAIRKGGNPLYLLYNFHPSSSMLFGSFPAPIELTGCAIINADFLFDNYYKRRINRNGDRVWLIPKFTELNPDSAFAWHELVCPNDVDSFYKMLQAKSLVSPKESLRLNERTSPNLDQKNGFYPINTFKRDGKWENVKDMLVQGSETFEQKESAYVSSRFRIDSDDLKNVDKEQEEKEKTTKYPIFAPKSRIVINKS